ncbi:putative TMV resistance protein N [Corchorus olitorius]|uniref:TMV resistance protein N n=1 Tax=Corchorus olitorius TaxID=93759 RepID=A0A1R3FUS4_9ROSI|nr:putative TMV resistance protein N [Corchorus olitorius]
MKKPSKFCYPWRMEKGIGVVQRKFVGKGDKDQKESTKVDELASLTGQQQACQTRVEAEDTHMGWSS